MSNQAMNVTGKYTFQEFFFITKWIHFMQNVHKYIQCGISPAAALKQTLST